MRKRKTLQIQLNFWEAICDSRTKMECLYACPFCQKGECLKYQSLPDLIEAKKNQNNTKKGR